MKNDFAVIVISHARPDVSTVSVLRDAGYTGQIYIVVDDEDPKLDEYKQNYGECLHIFHKNDWFDLCDNFNGPKSVGVYARNECLKVAIEHKLKYYLEMDDDLRSLSYRYFKDGKLKNKKIKSCDKVFGAIYDYFDNSKIDCLSFGSAVDYIGGASALDKPASRMATSSFFLRTDNDFLWQGRFTDDGITPIYVQKTGQYWCKFLSVQNVYDLYSTAKGKRKDQEGGSVATYKSQDVFVMRFYGVIYNPSCTKNNWIHGKWEPSFSQSKAFPVLVSGRWKK